MLTDRLYVYSCTELCCKVIFPAKREIRVGDVIEVDFEDPAIRYERGVWGIIEGQWSFPVHHDAGDGAMGVPSCQLAMDDGPWLEITTALLALFPPPWCHEDGDEFAEDLSEPVWPYVPPVNPRFALGAAVLHPNGISYEVYRSGRDLLGNVYLLRRLDLTWDNPVAYWWIQCHEAALCAAHQPSF